MDVSQILEQVVGPLGALVVLSVAMFFLYREYQKKSIECEGERQRADAAEQKYANRLVEEIQQWRDRDRTLELLGQFASNSKEASP